MSINSMLKRHEHRESQIHGSDIVEEQPTDAGTKQAMLHLEFDSQLIGKRVFSYDIDAEQPTSLDNFPASSGGAELIYVKSSDPLNIDKLSSSLNATISHVDEKVVFAHNGIQSDATPVDFDITTNACRESDYDDLLSLFWQSAEHSRFRCDPKLDKRIYKDLYRTWLDRSLKFELADEIYLIRDKKPIGVLTASFEDGKAEVGILSVDAEYRGRGIASALLSHLVSRCSEKQIDNISVPTQRANTQACALYQKNGFSEASSQFIYHCWANMDKVAAVIPVYGSPDSLPELCTRLSENFAKITSDYEIVLVDDHCPHGSWAVIEKLCEQYSFIKGIRFSKNFGQHYAIMAGLKETDADYVVIMDCDLQDKPEEIADLYRQAKQGFDKVLVRRVQKKHSLLSRATSYLFYKFLSYMTDTEQDSSVGNFGIYSRKVIDLLCSMPEKSRLLPVHARWLGFETAYKDIVHDERHSGESSYTFKKRMSLATDIILSFSDKPLWLVIKLGFFTAATSFLYAAYVFLHWLVGDVSVQGWTSLIISLWFLGGTLLATLGVVGIYVSKTFEETKKRPHFIIQDELNIGSKKK